VSNLAFSKTRSPSTALDRVEVAIHMAVEQHPTGRTGDDDSSTIISTSSERMPYLIGDLPELSLTPESTFPLPTVSPSPSIPPALTPSRSI
jgi:hypothetical protein